MSYSSDRDREYIRGDQDDYFNTDLSIADQKRKRGNLDTDSAHQEQQEHQNDASSSTDEDNPSDPQLPHPPNLPRPEPPSTESQSPASPGDTPQPKFSTPGRLDPPV